MEILYISTSCSKEKYNELFSLQKKPTLQPQVKFHRQIIEGLSKVQDVNVTCLSAYPISSSTCDINSFEETEEIMSPSLKYHYIAVKNGKLSHYTSSLRNSRKYVQSWIKETEGLERAIIADVLNIFLTINCFKIIHSHKIPFIGLITDVPTLSTQMKQRKISFIKRVFEHTVENTTEKLLCKYDAYITVTQTINDWLNKSHKPYVVMEGSVDDALCYQDRAIVNPRVVMYAGGVYEQYGVEMLVDAFDRIEGDTELHIYGKGTSVDYIKNKHNPHIKYMGIVSVDEVYKKEANATLLVNARPSNELFSKLSFPSKVHEYMSTGTPALLTKLDGIPSEYYNYCYLIREESVNGIYTALTEILSKSDEELREMGKRAFEFVSKEKNNVSQAHRIIKFIKSL